MFEVVDVVIASIGATAIALFTYSSAKRNRSRANTSLADKQKRRQQKFAIKELWEHAADASAYGLAVFILFIFNAAMNMSSFSIWSRLAIYIACFFALFVLLRRGAHSSFRYYRHRLDKSSQNTKE